MVFAREAGRALRSRGVEVEEFFVESRTSPVALWRDRCRLRSMVRNGGFDALHAQYGAVNGFLCTAAVGRLPFVLSLRGSDLNRVPSMNPLRNQLTRLLSQLAAWRADAVICVSEALSEQLWCDRRKVQVIPTGVDLEVFRPSGRSQARRELAWSDDESVVLFNAGKAPKQKGQPLVQKAVELLQARSISLRLHVTTGDHSREEMVRLLSAADCLVLASETEGSPNIVKEAMACNLPVVSVEAGDVRERLQGAQPGAIVARDPIALAQAIGEVIASTQRSNGRELLRQQGLGQAETVDRLQLIYASLGQSSR
jgi:glycosyltransferase involved in cell wall biosynthesis